MQSISKDNLKNFEDKISLISESFKDTVKRKDIQIESLNVELVNIKNKLNIFEIKCENLEIEKQNVKSEIMSLIEKQLEVDYNEKFIKSKN